MLRTAHRTTEALCKAAKARLQSRTTSRLHARPYQFRSPATTTWWLTCDSTWPAFHLAKLKFAKSGSSAPPWFVSVVVEKGLGAKLAPLCRTSTARNQVMTDTWQWHDFVVDLSGVELAEALDRVCEFTPVELRVDCAAPYVPGQDYDPSGRQPSSDALCFRIASGGRLELSSQELGQHKLDPLTRVATLGEAAQTLAQLGADEGLAFHWIDVCVGAVVHAAPEGSDPADAERWDTELAERLLLPLLPWVG
jgi:hypothetical protein